MNKKKIGFLIFVEHLQKDFQIKFKEILVRKQLYCGIFFKS